MAEESNKRRRLSEALMGSNINVNVNVNALCRGQPDAATSLAAALQSGGNNGGADTDLARVLMGGDNAASSGQQPPSATNSMMASLLSGLNGSGNAPPPPPAATNSLDFELARLLGATSQPQQASQPSVLSLLSRPPAPAAASNPTPDSILNLLGGLPTGAGSNPGLLSTATAAAGGGLQLNNLLQLVGGADATNSSLGAAASSTDPLIQALANANANAGSNSSQLLQALANSVPAPTSAPNISDLLSQLQPPQSQPPAATDLLQQLQQGLVTQDILQHLQQFQQQSQPQPTLDLELLRQLQPQQTPPVGDLLQQLQRAQAATAAPTPQDNLLQQLQQLQQPGGFGRTPAAPQQQQQQQSTSNLLQQLQAAAAKDNSTHSAAGSTDNSLASEINGLLHQLQQSQGIASKQTDPSSSSSSSLVSAKLSTRSVLGQNTALMAFQKTTKSTKKKRTKKTKKRKANPTALVSSATSTTTIPLRKAPVGLTGHKPECLYMPCDDERLSAYHVLARKQIEFFEACEEDTSTNARGRNRPIVLGQVGIRCRHCASVPPRRRQRAAMYYPFKLDLLYQASQTLANVHLCEQCQHIPQEIKEELQRLRGDKTTALVGKKYWADGARIRGVYESEDGMRFEPPKKQEPKEEGKEETESKAEEAETAAEMTTSATTTEVATAAFASTGPAASIDP